MDGWMDGHYSCILLTLRYVPCDSWTLLKLARNRSRDTAEVMCDVIAQYIRAHTHTHIYIYIYIYKKYRKIIEELR